MPVLTAMACDAGEHAGMVLGRYQKPTDCISSFDLCPFDLDDTLAVDHSCLTFLQRLLWTTMPAE